jgi:hypothetical protein
MINASIDISKTLNGKRHPAGKVSYSLLTLDDFGLAGPDSIDKESGLPVYGDDNLQFLQDCLTESCQATVRNIAKVEGDTPETLTIVPTRDYPASLADYKEGATGGRFFESRKLALELWAAWTANQPNVDAKGKAHLVALFGNSAAIRALSAKVKERLAAYVTRFVSETDPEKMAAVSSYLRMIETALNAEEVGGF